MLNELIVYDKALAKFFTLPKMKATNQECMPMVFATPQRAFARIEELYGLDVNGRVPLPALALHREPPAFDAQKYHHTDRVVVRYDHPPNHTKVRTMKGWQPVTISYVLEIWTLTQEEMLWAYKNIWGRFTHEIAYIKVDLEEYGHKWFSIRLDSVTDTSTLEPSEEERTLRGTVNATLTAVLHKPLITQETILSMDIHYRNWEDTEDLEVQEVTE